MKYDYDKIADAAYFQFNHAKIKNSVELSNHAIVDIGEKDEVIGLEILDLSHLCTTAY